MGEEAFGIPSPEAAPALAEGRAALSPAQPSRPQRAPAELLCSGGEGVAVPSPGVPVPALPSPPRAAAEALLPSLLPSRPPLSAPIKITQLVHYLSR